MTFRQAGVRLAHRPGPSAAISKPLVHGCILGQNEHMF
jgi:hypothetical protein